MKKLSYFLVVLLVFITGCNIESQVTKTEDNTTTSSPTISNSIPLLDSGTKYYAIKDFDFVTIEETTIQELLKFVPNEFYLNSSLGIFAQYPTEDGQYIVIVFSGETVVKDIFVSNIDRTDGLTAIQINAE